MKILTKGMKKMFDKDLFFGKLKAIKLILQADIICINHNNRWNSDDISVEIKARNGRKTTEAENMGRGGLTVINGERQ